ncbi:uncharacterized protein B0H18DRAFT_182427 [Fomitopsis serialis]|uniref:uncharacterized protein n=1 Tax=Fomitopsis serialis TaxID=139415 RepID=UPI00200757AF|nr:uncharacterized protein B0H18DRAFT_182427 [Neoantrodia serialis]KAH9913232.1 hypothetical protein B0H18DRAFT_182427 [Neoantrodia serialis]
MFDDFSPGHTLEFSFNGSASILTTIARSLHSMSSLTGSNAQASVQAYVTSSLSLTLALEDPQALSMSFPSTRVCYCSVRNDDRDSSPLSTFCRYMNCRTSLDDTSSFVVMHHLQKHHGVALRQSDGRDLFRCHWNDGIVKCGLTLSAYQLARHISKVHFKHTGGPVQCKYCGKPFSRPDNSLKRHELDCEESSLVKNNVDIDGLLRAAGQFLTRVCISSLVTNNLEHNTALEFLHFKIGFRDEKYQSYGFLPTIAEALHPTLSTAQSHQLKQITISLIAAGTPGLYRSLDRPRANLKLKGLHDVMRRPCFEALLEVEVQLTLNPPKGCDREEKDGIINNLSASFNTLLSPWADRGLLRVSYKDIYI